MAIDTAGGLLPHLGSRTEYFDYLEGYSSDRAMELQGQRARRGLVKS